QLPGSHPARIAMNRLQNPPEWELYDLENDSVEFENRAGDTELSKVEASLKDALTVWQKETDDQFSDPAFRREVKAKHAAMPTR
ncbi:MAG: hypothetical protein AAF585_06905, partial [Verrucomicrobiota bacterium]